MHFSAIVLAAGQGVRMHSKLPKVLHTVAGVSLLQRIINTVQSLSPQEIVIVHGENGQALKDAITNKITDASKESNASKKDTPKDAITNQEYTSSKITWALQSKPLGTGHATLQGLNALSQSPRVLILYGDIPLLRPETLSQLLEKTPAHALGLLTIETPDPTGLGRILRDKTERVIGIVEEKDANAFQKNIKEINVGVYICPLPLLQKWLPALQTQNAQKEYYLPDIIAMAVSENIPIETVTVPHLWEAQGVNTKLQLAELERIYQKEKARQLLSQGVTLLDPDRIDLRGTNGTDCTVTFGKDVTLDVNVILEGKVNLGDEVSIGPNVLIKDSTIQAGAIIKANSIIEGAIIGPKAIVGPFARIRPGTELSEEVHVGNFVEVKNTKVGPKSKMNHLSYLGDAKIGKEVNIGAGTITCNYDGINKHMTVIEDAVFIGSDTQLIAPITVGKGATIGAGTTLVKDVPPGHLTHNHIEHRVVADWESPRSLQSQSQNKSNPPKSNSSNLPNPEEQ